MAEERFEYSNGGEDMDLRPEDAQRTVNEAAEDVVIELSKLSAAQLDELADKIIVAIREKE
jgi:hypothetical protein